MITTRKSTASGHRLPGPGTRAASLIVLLILANLSLTMPVNAATTEPQDPVHPQPDSGLEAEPPSPLSLPELREPSYWETNLFKRWLGDQKFLATTWWRREFRRPGFGLRLALGAILAASSDGGKSGLDERVALSWRHNLGGADNNVARGLSRLGDTRTGIALVGGAYLLGRWSRNERLARSSSLAAEALLNAGVWNVALKKLARRTRPAGDGQDDSSVERPLEGQSGASFPSGHAMGAFAVATVLADEYRDRRWVPWVAYATAGLIGGSRVSLGRHYPSDVMVGALLGRSLGKMVTARQRGGGDKTLTRLEPLVMPGGQGYGITYVRTW